MTPVGVSIVVPTVGRPSLTALLAALAAGRPPTVGVEILIVDDRRDHRVALALPTDLGWAGVKVLTGRSAGPAAARNTGWRAARHEWVAFLDDDVLPDPDWLDRLVRDVQAAGPRDGGVQGRVRVPQPADRRPTDWERVTAGLADGEWITADMAYRRTALQQAGGFDERLPRAFREDAELAYRVRRAGWQLVRGTRGVTHPVRPEGPWVSVRTQAGNADDALLRRLYGPRWRTVLQVPPGRRRRHAVITAAGLTALGCAAAAVVSRPAGGARPVAWWAAAATGAAVWAALTTEFAAARIVGGPADRREIATMLATSVAIPPVAVTHWWCGWWRWRGATAPAGSR